NYVARILRDYTSPRGLKVAWDSGNGAAGPAMEKLIESLPGTHYPLNSEVNGDFPNHHPDPTVPECLKQLQMEVAERGCDLGIAFDGDGDRIGVVDDQGEILWGDQLMVLFAADVLGSKPNSTIIADVKASQVLFDEILKMGGAPEMWRTGHSLIKSRMIETGAPLAGEMSGHIFFADKWFGFDDGLYAAVRLLSFLGKQNKPLSEFRAELPKVYNTPEIRIACEDLRKFDVVTRVLSSLRDSNAKIIDVDGIRVQTDDGWWLLRASNTEPVLVARCESYTASGLQRLKDTLRDQLSENGVKISEL
ncbi:MAG: phosphomannomutase/phosphoglucomutase, partial [Rhodospirillaceae bacterium]